MDVPPRRSIISGDVSNLAEGAGSNPIECDVAIVGGGINGAGIARDLAGRNWRVVLVEQDDLGAHTSSASTKLIHGGLRYLEFYEFALVRKALREREVLMKCAPHLIRPLRFVMPHNPNSAFQRPAWLIRAGLFLYDHLARREVLPGSRSIDLRTHALGRPLRPEFTRGFIYSDGWVDDSRLVVLNALDARERGAQLFTQTRCADAQRSAHGWTLTLRGAGTAPQSIRARALVNAAGPWAESFLRHNAKAAAGESLVTKSLRLVKGSHIVVPQCFEHDHAYLFQSPDRRVIFAIPYEQRFTLIGTTDVELHGEPHDACIDDAEVSYLCEQASRYLREPVTASNVVWSYSGVRPLLDDHAGDPSAVTRDYRLEPNAQAAPLLSVWGGKITTSRKLAEEAADLVGQMLGEKRAHWTKGAYLPGGDLANWIGPLGRPDADFDRFVVALRGRYAWLTASLALRFARAYGARVDRFLGSAQALKDLGPEIAPGLHEAELRYLQREEWAMTGTDVLWRRTKLGLHYSQAERERVEAWMTRHVQMQGVA